MPVFHVGTVEAREGAAQEVLFEREEARNERFSVRVLGVEWEGLMALPGVTNAVATDGGSPAS